MKKILRLLLMSAGMLEGLPKHPEIVHGQVEIESMPSGMRVNSGDKAIIDWNSFSIEPGQCVRFDQLSANSAVLNRVIGSETSEILGALTANGKVYLINPHGIIFGENCTVNASSFIASTLDVLNEDFLQEGDLLFRGESGTITHFGTIRAVGGDVVLISRHVVNLGALEAPQGTVSLAEGTEVLFKPLSKERIYIRPHLSSDSMGIDQSGTISALRAELKADGNPYIYAIKNAGSIQTIGLQEENGEIYLVANQGIVEVTGTMHAEGGTIHILGEKVGLLEGAVVDVSGPCGGGEILIGGDFQGKNPTIMNSQITVMGPDANIKADATVKGNGGRVIVWADDITRFYGSISAQGGPLGGDGGFVEVSGKNFLEFQGLANRSASSGKAGMLLMDPTDITISVGADANNMFGGGCGANTYCGTAAAANINSGNLAVNLGLGPVTITTSSAFGGTGNITILDNVSWVVDNNLTLIADQNIFVAAIVECSSAAGGDISMTANNGGLIWVGSQDALGTPALLNSNIGTQTGTITLTTNGGGDIRVGTPTFAGFTTPSQVGYAGAAGAPTGNIVIRSSGRLLVQGGVSNNSFAFAQIGHGFVTGALALSPSISGNIDIQTVGNIQVFAGAAHFLAVVEGNYAQIGHGGFNVSFLNVGNTVSGNIDISSSTGNLKLQGDINFLLPTSLLNYAHVGHLGSSDNVLANMPIPATVSGDVTINVFETVDIGFGTSGLSYTHIGHGGTNLEFQNPVSGNISITTNNTSGGEVFVFGGGFLSSPRACWGQIGHGGGVGLHSNVSSSSLSGNIDITINGSNGGVLVNGSDFAALNTFSSAQIGHGGAGFAQINNGGISGDITATLTGTALSPAKVVVKGGNAANNYGQIGHGGSLSAPDFISGLITIQALGPNASIDLTGPSGSTDTGQEAYGQIGHGGSAIAPGSQIPIPSPQTGTISGNIQVVSDDSISITGATTTPALMLSIDGGGQIGHGGTQMVANNALVVIQPAFAITGLIDVTANGAGNAISLFGGTGSGDCGAWIGHGYLNSLNGNPVTITGNVNVMAPNGQISIVGSSNTGSLNATAVIGSGMDLPNPMTTFVGNQQVIAGGPVTISGGIGPGGEAILSLQTIGEAQTVSGQSIALQGGTGLNTDAGIVATAGAQTITAIQDITALGGQSLANQALVYITNQASGILLSDTTVTSQNGSVIFQNGVAANNQALFHSRIPSPPSDTGAGLTVSAAGDIFIANDLNTLTTHAIGFFADTNNDGLGGFKVDTGLYMPGNVLVVGGAAGVILKTVTGNLVIHSASKFANGSTADFQISDPADLSLFPPLYPAQLLSTGGNIEVTGNILDEAFQNISLTSNMNVGAVTMTGSVLIVANNNMTMTRTSLVSAGGDVTLVVDNQFPFSPSIGGGAFAKNNTSTITSGNALRIFTARQPLNTISGNLNGIAFAPGIEFIDTQHEQWGSYFFNPFFGGPGFTVFYKNFNLAPPATLGQIAVSQEFTYLNAWDNYLYWALKFSVEYNRAAYKKARKLKGMSSYHVIPDREYIMPPVWKADGHQYNEALY